VRNSYLLLLLLIGINSGILAQERPVDRFGLPIPQRGLQLSLIHWLDPSVPGPHISYLHALSRDREYLRVELGYLMDLNYQEALEVRELSGLRARTTWRKYRYPLSTQGSVRFRELSLSYRYLDMALAGDFWRSDFQYQERLTYRLRQHNLSLSYIVGQSLLLAPGLRLDVGIGVGGRLRLPLPGKIPDDAVFDTNGYFLWFYDDSRRPEFTPTFPVLLHLGYFW
jgi:hypothetical protein